MTTRRPNGIPMLFVDDDMAMAEGVRRLLELEFAVTLAATGEAALVALESAPETGLIVTDIVMPGMSGLELLRAVKARYGDAKKTVLITGYGTISEATEAIRQGAAEYLLKPVDGSVLRAVLRRLSAVEDPVPDSPASFHGMLGGSRVMRDLWKSLELFAASDSNILLEGETGTGKELAAKAIHALSPRDKFPLVKLNCAAVPDSLLESELFGHERGAFTGALARKTGLFEQAHQGTLFLDEVGDMSPLMQAKLLRVLQEGELQRVGGDRILHVNVRVVAASNKPLARLVEEGAFRADLLFRLNTLFLRIPPLRQRGDDILALAEDALRRLAARHHRPAPRIPESVRDALLDYAWPGNVRELLNTLERMFVLAKGAPELDPATLQLPLAQAAMPRADGSLSLEDIEKVYIQYVLKQHPGNKSLASQTLGISRDTLYRKIKKYELS